MHDRSFFVLGVRICLSIVFGAAIAIAPPHAQAQKLANANTKPAKRGFERTIDTHIVFEKSGLRTSTHRIVTQINLSSALHSLGQFRIRSNRYFEDMEIVEAATLKSNGERRNVPRDKIMQMTGSQSGSALFNADTQTHVVPFSDLAIGDKTLLVYKRKQKKLLLPGIVSLRWMFAASPFVTSNTLILDVPDVLKLSFAERGLVRSSSSVPDGRRYRWSVAEGKAASSERLSVSWLDFAPAIFASNQKDWKQFATTYHAMIEETAKPDELVRVRAQAIAKGLNDPQDIARAMFNWTSRNIRYFRVVLGRGGWMPHQCGSVLQAGYGDCKDHATLLKALLASKGIESEVVLVNQARVFKHYPLPVSAFDHMILYVPQFNRYLDPTAPRSSFDHVPLGLQGKPVVHINKNGGHVSRIPAADHKVAKIVFEAAVTIGRNGRVSGRSKVHGYGPLQQLLRNDARRIESLGPAAAARRYISHLDVKGTGSMQAPEPLALVTPFVISAKFQLDAKGGKSEGMNVPTGPKVYAPPVNLFGRGIRQGWSRPFICTPLTYVEKITVQWPKDMKIKAVPKNVRAISGFARYRAIYKRADNTLSVLRTFIVSPPELPCQPRHLNLAQRVLSLVRHDWQQKIVFDNLQTVDDAFDDRSDPPGGNSAPVNRPVTPAGN